MGGGSSSAATVADTKFYDLLGVTPDASVAELQKAYKRKALRLHPDKGGDPEEFKAMKDAYDVLMNPEKRKVYDRYGPALVSVMNGEAPPSMEAFVALLASVSRKERVMAACVVVGAAVFALSPLVTLSLRWDGDTGMPWPAAFVPFWALEGVIMYVIATRSAMPEPEEEMDDESREMYSELKRHFRMVKVFGSAALLLLAAQQALVAVRLEGVLRCSWVLVLSPWILAELALLAAGVVRAPAEWASEERTQPARYVGRLARQLAWNVARLASAALVAARAQELTTGSWLWCLMPPALAGASRLLCAKPPPTRCRASQLAVGARVCVHDLQARPELNGLEGLLVEEIEGSGRWTVQMADGGQVSLKPQNLQPLDEDGAEQQASGRPGVCRMFFWLPWLYFAARKLDGERYSAFLVFLPMFLAVCGMTCLLSCSFLCITAEMVEESMAARGEPPDGGAGFTDAFRTTIQMT